MSMHQLQFKSQRHQRAEKAQQFSGQKRQLFGIAGPQTPRQGALLNCNTNQMSENKCNKNKSLA